MVGYHKLLALPLFFLWGSAINAAHDAEEAGTVFRKALKHRRDVKSAQWQIDYSLKCPSDPDSNVDCRMNISFEGNKSRIEKLDHSDQRQVILCLNCENESFAALILHPRLYEDPTQKTKPIVPYDLKEKRFPLAYLHLHELNLDLLDGNPRHSYTTKDYSIPGLRDVGLVPIGFGPKIHDVTLDFFSKNFEHHKSFTVQTDPHEGDMLTKVSWVDESAPMKGVVVGTGKSIEATIDTTCHFWFDPQRNWTVRKAVQENNIGWRETLTNTIKQDSESGVWYPSHWIFERTRKGQSYVREEGILEAISINKPFAKDYFTLGDIDELEPGTDVRWSLKAEPPASGRLFWSGKDIVGEGDYRLIQSASKNGQSARRFLMIALVNIALISALIGTHLYRRRFMKST